jgi:hypothetical protein
VTPPGRLIDEVPPHLLPLFNAALSLMYPSAAEVDPGRAFRGTTTATFAMHVLDLLPLSEQERAEVVAAAREEARAAMVARAERTRADLDYYLTGASSPSKAKATADLLASLGDLKL